MPSLSIPGVTKTSLWQTWKLVRREVRRSSIRDVVDFLDYDVDPNVWIGTLLKQLKSGRYEPATPTRFTLGKSSGFSRVMTLPSIPDLVLYRTIVDFVYERARHKECKHAYFRRPLLQRAQRLAVAEAAERMEDVAQYGTLSERAFYNWLRYNQYRKYLLLAHIYPCLVVTDISNFFDSILHSHVEEALRGLRIPARMTGLLFFLLERLSVRQDYAGSHGISLPVDEFDCSRTLAHLVLFPHDERMVSAVGEEAYVRWMDDQNLGVRTRAEGLRVLGEVGRSLARSHLTPNPKKSKILALTQARRHFHLDLNALLDDAEKVLEEKKGIRYRRRKVQRICNQVWSRAQRHEGVGEFEKVLKRLYRLAGFCRARFLRPRAKADALCNPGLSERICDYMRASGTEVEYLRFIESILSDQEQVYEDVSVVAVESLLRLRPGSYAASRIRKLASQLLRGELCSAPL